MTKYHLIFDYSFLYYKYKFSIEYGNLRPLSITRKNDDGTEEVINTSFFYSMRVIENIRRSFEADNDADVTISICFDSYSNRKLDTENEVAVAYKANRKKTLTDDDYQSIDTVRNLFTKAGYNVYKADGFEADDLIASLVDKFKSNFDSTIIYTPDLDLAVHVQEGVSLMRYKTLKNPQLITCDNFSEVISQELKCTMPYNAVMLYKVTVGDTSDNIPGIKGFGPKTFDKMVNYLNSIGTVKWYCFNNTVNVLGTINFLAETNFLSDEQKVQALKCLEVVKPREKSDISVPTSKSTRDLREKAYKPYGMVSLID